MRVHEFAFRSLQGASMPLERWSGQPILLVNTASECGFTPQYTKLQALWNEYRPAGLIVLGVPCNDFGAQEPGDNESISDFCTSRFQATFPMTQKLSIIGREAHPLFIAMREEYTSDILPNWNFFKYLFGRDGNLLHHWPSNVEPDEPGFRHEIERNLGSWTL
ncbi:MAG: glutathione peroxidase [Xanthomonadales bacterium]|nr:glutathione peroxidase [Gammaproteobacteria bacterium]MBT8052716.1 glutathione peroxidase [Gammaproteobacteria bacterium]NND57378.1 glutathione peroxidase [Xanthomonadales bacterium]NNK50626.1 glutathione peroxidase [Xanthomonadales bacterium]